jgi:hypothetical protein
MEKVMQFDAESLLMSLMTFALAGNGIINCAFLPPRLIPFVAWSAFLAAGAAWGLASSHSGLAATAAFWGVATVARIADLTGRATSSR